jgi:hypothetical protein
MKIFPPAADKSKSKLSLTFIWGYKFKGALAVIWLIFQKFVIIL